MKRIQLAHSPANKTDARAVGPPGARSAGARSAVSFVPPRSGVALVDRAEPGAPQGPVQAKAGPGPAAPGPSRPGQLPAGLRAGVEALSGLSMEGVRVHFDSPWPRQMQALACTRGQEIHLGPGQRHHLPHEAWHVVQQMQGRVGATDRVGSVAINDSPALESEADRMGDRAKAHRPDGRPTTAPAPAGPVSGVTQRKVGFEFEMNWHVKAPGNTIGMHQAIIRGTNWEATPDMAQHPNPLEQHYTGWGDLEYVTAAFDENLLGRTRLSNTLDEIVGLTERMASRYGSIFRPDDSIHLSSEVGGGIQWGASTPPARRDDILIVRHEEPPVASPQMTAGIRLENVSQVLGEMGAAPQAGVPNLFGRDTTPVAGLPSAQRTQIAQVQARAAQQALLVQAGDMDATQRRIYEGAIAHLGLTVALGAAVNVGTNEKYLSPLLSRTNFGDLPAFVRQHPTFKSDVLIASGLATVHTWGAVRHNNLFSASPLMPQRSIDAWLSAIRAGNDPLHWGREGDLNRWLPQTVGSLPNRSAGHVFEFRGISRRIPVAQWKAWALAHFDHVRNDLNA